MTYLTLYRDAITFNYYSVAIAHLILFKDNNLITIYKE